MLSQLKNIILGEILVLSLMSSSMGYACSCMEHQAPFDDATEIYSGKVIDISQPLIEKIGITKTGIMKVKFRITKLWRGSVSKTKVVSTKLQGEACGYPFEIGKEYLVVVDKEREIDTGICTGTKDIEHAAADIEALNKVYAFRQDREGQ